MASYSTRRLARSTVNSSRLSVPPKGFESPANTQYAVAKAQQQAATAQVLTGRRTDAAISAEAIEAACSVDLRDKILDAVVFGLQMFRTMAHFRGIRVMAVSAIGTPGCLNGPSLAPHILNYLTVCGVSGLQREIAEAAADGIGVNFAVWQQQVSVPGLPWYPSFAAWPGAMAPPTPNVPFPLSSCASTGVAKITSAPQLKDAIVAALPDALRGTAAETLLHNIATSVAMYFQLWVLSQQVTLVMGKGPVPGFAPPYTPVGTVVGGDIIEVPPHLSAGSQPGMMKLPLSQSML